MTIGSSCFTCKKIIIFATSLALSLLILANCVTAQSGATQMSRGVAGERDARGRNPELFVTRVVKENSVSLLVDAHVPHHDYQQYPMKFEFYINRNLFTSQVRSQELPGPVGVDIGPDVATPPFNFAVIAYVLHPTRSTHSMVAGAFYTTELGAQLSCASEVAVGLIESVEETQSYSSNPVAINQTADNQFTFEAEFVASDDSKLQYTGTLTLNEGNLSGTVSVRSGSKEKLVSVTGTATLSDSTLSNFEVASADGLFDLRCE